MINARAFEKERQESKPFEKERHVQRFNPAANHTAFQWTKEDKYIKPRDRNDSHIAQNGVLPQAVQSHTNPSGFCFDGELSVTFKQMDLVYIWLSTNIDIAMTNDLCLRWTLVCF